MYFSKEFMGVVGEFGVVDGAPNCVFMYLDVMCMLKIDKIVS